MGAMGAMGAMGGVMAVAAAGAAQSSIENPSTTVDAKSRKEDKIPVGRRPTMDGARRKCSLEKTGGLYQSPPLCAKGRPNRSAQSLPSVPRGPALEQHRGWPG